MRERGDDGRGGEQNVEHNDDFPGQLLAVQFLFFQQDMNF
jgi:hypothetical protein